MLPRNITLFHSAALGDFIHTWPLGLALGRLFPQSRCIFITHRQKGLLAEKALSLESADVELGWHHLFGDASKLPESNRLKLAASHTIVSFVAKPGDAWLANVSSIAPKAQLITPTSGPAAQIAESLAPWPFVQTAVHQLLASIAERGISIKRPAEKGPIGIHPGAGSPAKCWPIDSYLSLIDRLQKSGHPCKILLGEVELEHMPQEKIRQLESAAEAVHPATYIDLLNELAHASAHIGNDTGPTHLASIIGLPTVALFGPTDPNIWKPLGPRVATLHKNPIDAISVDEVFETITKKI
jgi:heptosyltransferase-3